MILLSIDVSLLDKSRFKRVQRKNGKTAVFAELILVESKDDQYGNDYMVKESATKEERAARKQFPIIGNARIVRSKLAVAPSSSAPEKVDEGDGGDDVLF